MPQTSRGFRYPASSNQPNVVQDIQNLASDVDSLTRIPVVASIAARNALGTPYAGKAVLVAGNTHVYDGSTWRFTLYGVGSGSTDGSGLLSVTHGAGQTPISWAPFPGNQGTDALNQIISLIAANSSSTTLTVRAVRTDTNAYLASNPIAFNWWARF